MAARSWWPAEILSPRKDTIGGSEASGRILSLERGSLPGCGGLGSVPPPETADMRPLGIGTLPQREDTGIRGSPPP